MYSDDFVLLNMLVDQNIF